MNETPPYRLDIEGLDDPIGESGSSRMANKSWVGIHFSCCGVYTRIYRNEAGTAYRGRCPRCGKPVMLRVGPDGTDARFFVAD